MLQHLQLYFNAVKIIEELQVMLSSIYLVFFIYLKTYYLFYRRSRIKYQTVNTNANHQNMIMKKVSAIIISALFILLSNPATYAQLSATQTDSLVQKAMQEFKVAGIAVAIVKDGKVIFEKGYGVRSIATKLPVDAHTNFQIASNTKAFTTAALAILGR
jgi:hypothetical protein